MRAPGTLSQSSEGCLVLEVHTYAPPAELAWAVAIWALDALVAALALYCTVLAVKIILKRDRTDWLAGYEVGVSMRAEPDRQNVTRFPGSPAA